ncbi:hypothetical protein D8Y24_01565 [Agrococcus lahaulensis]|nr:hypothetical protein D8Y24_01565 [Agrococcus lahaulensis]
MMGFRSAANAVFGMVLGSGAQMVSNVVAAMAATAWLSLSERGVMVTIMAIAGLSSVFGTLGVGAAFRARLPREELATGALTASFVMAGACFAAFAAALAAGAMLVLDATSSPGLATPPQLLAVVLATVGLAGLSVLADLRIANGRYASSGRWAALAALAGLAGLMASWLLFPASAVSLVLGQSAGVCFALVLSAWAAVRSRLIGSSRPTRTSFGALVRTGVGMMVLPSSLALLTRADRVILEVTEPSSVVAIYALAATYVEVVRIVPTAIGQMASRAVAQGVAFRKVLQLCAASGVASVLLGGAMVAMAAIATEPLFGADYADAVVWALFLIPAEVGYAVLAVMNFALIGGMWSRSATALGVAAAGLGVVAYVTGATFGGAVGLIVARDITMLVVAAGAVVLAAVLFRRRRPLSAALSSRRF